MTKRNSKNIINSNNNNNSNNAESKASSITLYPPFETESDISAAGKDVDADADVDENSNMYLSRELKRSFDTVRDIHMVQLQKKRLKENGNVDVDINVDMNIDVNVNANVNVNVQDEEMLHAKKFEAAVAAAVAAESEISTLSKGITELENMLLLHNQESLESASATKEDIDKHDNVSGSGSGSGSCSHNSDVGASESDGGTCTAEKFPALPRKVGVQGEDDDPF